MDNQQGPPCRGDRERYYSAQEVATIYGVTDKTIRNRIHAGKLRARRIGRLYRIPESALDDFDDGS